LQVRKKVLCVVGARPNFMKIAPIMRAMQSHAAEIDAVLVHTGQHYDEAMSERFFQELQIPAPDVSLDVGSGSHAEQTAEIMKRFEPVLDLEEPDCVLVVGDVNSTLACALVAAKKGILLVHVEAGLRSGDRRMPEEINRLVTDRLSDRLYTSEAAASINLAAEGIAPGAIVFVGNVMIDTLMHARSSAVPATQTLRSFNAPETLLEPRSQFAVLTLHRPSNVDDPVTLRRLVEVLTEVARELPIVFPVHPRTRSALERCGLQHFLTAPGVIALPPLGYQEILGLMLSATLVLTDSGGVQEETTALGIPCLTIRDNTERPITISEGTNTLVGSDPIAILAGVAAVVSGGGKSGRRPELWDGNAAGRIVEDLLQWLHQT